MSTNSERIINNETPKCQSDLPGIDTGRHSRATRREALKAERSPMLERVLEYVRSCKWRGATRDEIAIHCERPVQSITRPVLDLINDQSIVETKNRRPTRWGRSAVVIVAAEWSEVS